MRGITGVNNLADTVIELAEKFKAALAKQDLAAERRLIDAYKALWNNIKKDVDLLIMEISAADGMTPRQVLKMERYGALMADIRKELDRYSAFTEVEMTTAARKAIRMGEGNARILVAAQLGNAKLSAQLRRINPEAIERLLGFLTPGGELYKRLDGLSEYTAKQVSDAIVEGVGLGRNPKVIARDITRAFGIGLTNSLRTMRTVQLWSYREANRASYLANDDVVRGWVWYADIAKACPACLAMHGTEHTNDEVLDDHYNGGCAAIPLVIGAKNTIPSGESVFSKLSEAEQKQRLGEEKWNAWKDGLFSFNELATEHDDEVYGTMKAETPLWQLLGAEPPGK